MGGKVGRPTLYTPELAAEICRRVADGKSLVKVCRGKGMPNRDTVYQWLSKHKEFADNYARAREISADRDGEEVRELADSIPDFATREQIDIIKLRMEARKWSAARKAPKNWGDKTSAELSGSLSITPVLNVTVGGNQSALAPETGAGADESSE